ncbi:spermidine synthase [Bradyrhizobium sp. WSM3983]|uniref:spermine/spermidine synthase domain-containing protein n=1 Tax=Bradyrhizobium sp. WSM3983 TaxID=1038867 RepID=UPI00041AD3FE|nr:spermidine synthase [Bradyrhizobium sp. WSM3983]
MNADRASTAATDLNDCTIPPASAAVAIRPASRRQRLFLLPIMAASGFAGLGYEIVWTRQFALALGTEMMAVLGAVSGFFAGLALGAFLLDGPIRRASSPWRVYAALEAIIGVWGILCIWLLPVAGRILAPLIGAEPALPVLWGASFALPTLILAPATIAMGGTLTAIERIVSGARSNERVSAGVYGANTAGAVAGALVSAFVILPAIGLAGTQIVLAAVNAACALAAWLLDAGPTVNRESARSGAVPTRLAVTLFATGLLGIAFEMLVVRLAVQVLQDTIYTFAGLLAAYLLGVALGGLAWQRAGSRTSDTSLGWLLAGVALSILATAALAPAITGIAEAAADQGLASEIAVALALFLVPSALMGATFGLLLQRGHDRRGTLGYAVGINAAGACVAPLLTAQILIPWLGTWLAIVVVALAYLVLLPLRRATIVWGAAPALAAAVLLLRPMPSMIRIPAGGSLLAVREGPMATASVVDDASGAKYLEVNGRFRMGGTSSMRSDYRQALLPLLLHPAPRQALFLGLGTGATLVGGTKLPSVSVHGVELSQEVVDLMPRFVDPQDLQRTRITVADARRYIVADTALHDVIIADLFHPALDGSGALYTREHFEAIRRRLAPQGIFCQWLPLYQLDAPSLHAIIRSFLSVYPEGSAWLNHYSVRTPMLALIGPRDAGSLDLAALRTRLDTPAVAAAIRPLGFESALDLLGQYLAGPRALSHFSGAGPMNTDDFPFVTFDAERNVRALSAPPWSLLLDTIRSIRTDPEELLEASRSGDFPRRLASYWAARNRFIEAGAALRGEPRGRALIDAAAPELIETLRLSPEFDPAYRPLLGMAQALAASDRPAARRLLKAITSAAPGREEAGQMLKQISAAP